VIGLVVAATMAAVRPHHAAAVTAADDYVQLRNGRFTLHGQPFVLRGTNYFGSWRTLQTFSANNGTEQGSTWSLFHGWKAGQTALDFQFLAAQLNATAVRIGTPAHDEFAGFTKYHGYEPWYQPDGSITDTYKKILVGIADTAYANGIRVEFCLLWNIGNEIAAHPDAFASGGDLDRFYANQVRSIGLTLRDHPGAMAFSVGNEVLVRYALNGTHRSDYEGRAAAFIIRRLKDLHEVAPQQLRTSDELASPGLHSWRDPGPEFAVVRDPADERRPAFRLLDALDYLGPHFYPEILKLQDLPDDAFRPKVADAVEKLSDYMRAARSARRPVVVNEFGLKIDPPALDRAQYSGPRDTLYREFLMACQRNGTQGLLAWIAMPEFVLRPGDYTVAASHVNPASPVEVDVRSSRQRILFYNPVWELFVWNVEGDTPRPTAAAQALAAAWPGEPSAGH
jgi:hypothetical protein